MKKSLLTVATASMLSMGFVAGMGFDTPEQETQAADAQAIMKRMAQLEHAITQNTHQLKIAINQQSKKIAQMENISAVTEDFVITEVGDDGWVRGELADGDGEGIYYPVETLKDHGMNDIAEGEYISVTWPLDAYNNGEWDQIINIRELFN